MTRLRLAMACFAALALTGCAGRPEGVLTPVGYETPGTSRVDLLVATTRSDEGATRGQMFTGERGVGLRFADISVSIPPDQVRQIGEVQWPAKVVADPAREFATLRADRIDQKEALARFHARLKRTKHRNVLLFVHGYNTRFEESVYRFSQIVHDSRAPALPLLFTWPSRGRLLAYTYDRESTNYSRDALEAILQTLAKDPAVGEISILAHSMGNWVTLEALRQMSIRNGRIAPKIKSVMLAAPDVDVDVFRRQIATIGEQRPPFVLFVSQDDRALAFSSRVWGNTPRLGAIDPRAEPFRSQLEKERVQVVDLTTTTSVDSLNHAKFASNPQVVQMIGGRLAAGQTLSDSKAGIGETIGFVATGAASTVGRAASIAISAPVAIVDPRTREGLADQFQDLGGQLGGTVSSAAAAAAIPVRR
ncbi:MAG: alpha/beta hydrolase [Hyphomicrobiales bacterium]|nr:alpha/beta hydrolase [Hyphomicrobiales bacterium]